MWAVVSVRTSFDLEKSQENRPHFALSAVIFFDEITAVSPQH